MLLYRLFTLRSLKPELDHIPPLVKNLLYRLNVLRVKHYQVLPLLSPTLLGLFFVIPSLQPHRPSCFPPTGLVRFWYVSISRPLHVLPPLPRKLFLQGAIWLPHYNLIFDIALRSTHQ